MVDLVEKENEVLKLNVEQIATLEKEFMDTFETVTVIKPIKRIRRLVYCQLIVFCFKWPVWLRQNHGRPCLVARTI